jgi:hypothetical protein
MSESNKLPQIRGPADYHSIPIQGDPPAPSLSRDRRNVVRLDRPGSSWIGPGWDS